MGKYWSVFKISFHEEFAYRLNFIMWRVRSILQMLLIFFLWDSVFAKPETSVFGYDRTKILTYIFGLFIVRAIVLSSRSADVAGEIARGDLTNYLLKPMGYIKYWFMRDISSKALNLVFAVGEIALLFFLLRPEFYIQTNPLTLVLFVFSLIVAVILYFLLIFMFSLFPLWYPEQAWGAVFLLGVFVEFLAGGSFPLDILPDVFQKLLYALPFPYLIFVPIQIYLGKFDTMLALRGLIAGSIWILILGWGLKTLWSLGLKSYRAEGR